MATPNPLTCTLSSRTYLVHPQVLGRIAESVRPDAIIPVTLLSEDDVLSADLDALLAALVRRDDVLSEEFVRVLVTKPERVGLATQAGGVSRVYPLKGTEDDETGDGEGDVALQDLPSGPYFIAGGNLHQAWRLHLDPNDTFVSGVFPTSITRLPRSETTYSPTPLGIPVPSRLFSPPNLPLAGLRLALTDGIDVAGTASTLSSRAFASVQAPAETSAPVVRALLDAGAVVVGKCRTTALLCGREFVDVGAPFNPRADGYQIVGGSSSGASAAAAGYEWLDGAVGTDTVGGISWPGGLNGTWAIRPTWGCSDLTGVQPMCSRFDTLGPFSRSASTLHTLAKHLLSIPRALSLSPALPTKLLVPCDIFRPSSPEHKRLHKSFVRCLEAHLGIKHTTISFSKLWSRTAPEGCDEPLQMWMEDAPGRPMFRDVWRSYGSFRRTYAERNGGRSPFVDPTAGLVFALGKNVSDEDYAEHVRRNGVFKAWFEEQVVRDVGTIMAVPLGETVPRYRDDVPPSPSPEGEDWCEVGASNMASILEVPLLVAPFAQTPYLSRVSGVEEHLPVCSGVIGSKGTDLILIRMMDDAFKKAGWRTEVDTGRYAFPLGDGEREVQG